jgi:tetratricopeptide (TPR) repeat protein
LFCQEPAKIKKEAVTCKIAFMNPTASSSKRRLWFMRLFAMIVVPLFVLGVAELGLRLAGYGYDTSFFSQIRIQGQDYYVANDQFGYRFFPPDIARTPVPQRLAVNKSPHTCRIFVFGESAAMGDPDYSYGAWRYLQVLLRERFPGTDFEVVCVAMTAINSHAILPMARECARRDGDLWIIYMGNNEMVGPFGAGTVFGSRAPGVGFVRTDLAIKTMRIGQLLNSLVQRWGLHSSTPTTWSGLSMFTEHQLRYDDPNRLRAYGNFRRNLADILRAGHDAGVPMILSTVGSNLKDCAPFASLHAAALGETQRAEWDGIYQAGIALESAGDYHGALGKYAEANAIDPQYAELHFRAGRSQLALTNSAQALREFELARDYDTLAFRADTRINQTIKDAADAYVDKGVCFLDAARMLAQDSPENIPGNEWFYEHVHLSFEGNYWLGRAFAEATAKLLSKSVVAHDKGEWASSEFCDRRLAISSWDRHQVWQDILGRISEPPYTEQLTHDASINLCEKKLGELKSRMDSETPEQMRQLYGQALAVAPTDNILHWNFARYLAPRGDLARATEELKRGCELLPQMPGPYADIGNLLIPQGKIDEAAEYFSRGLAIRGNGVRALNGLGQILANQQKTKEAAACFRHALRVESDDVETYINLGFLAQDQGNIKQAAVYYQRAASLQPQGPADYFNQAVGFSALGLGARAVESFGMAIQLKPEFWQARYLLGVEIANQGRIGEAQAQFLEVIRYRPDFAPAHIYLGIALAAQNKPDQALGEFRTALKLDPANSTARQEIEIIQSSAKRN